MQGAEGGRVNCSLSSWVDGWTRTIASKCSRLVRPMPPACGEGGERGAGLVLAKLGGWMDKNRSLKVCTLGTAHAAYIMGPAGDRGGEIQIEVMRRSLAVFQAGAGVSLRVGLACEASLHILPPTWRAPACHATHLAPAHPRARSAATEACQKSIEGNKGKLVVKEAARTVSDRDDRLLAEKMDALENANKEVDGDLDSESEDEGMGGDVDKAGLQV
eukprot:365807-Chlamydomonas_euryale.AAC.15